MFLTRITLSPAAFRARNLLASSQSMHAALAASFPVSGERYKDGAPLERLLWRLDHGKVVPEPVLYVASPHGPDMDEAVERITTPERIVTKDFQTVLDAITAGALYSFRLAANPTRYERRKRKAETPTGHITTHQRIPLTKHGDQVAWLVGKLADAGAATLPTTAGGDSLDVVVDGERSDTFTRQDIRRSRRASITIKRVAFKGHLTVTDPDKFRSALSVGIGPAKGYGCGLLTIAAPVVAT